MLFYIKFSIQLYPICIGSPMITGNCMGQSLKKKKYKFYLITLGVFDKKVTFTVISPWGMEIGMCQSSPNLKFLNESLKFCK